MRGLDEAITYRFDKKKAGEITDLEGAAGLRSFAVRVASEIITHYDHFAVLLGVRPRSQTVGSS